MDNVVVLENLIVTQLVKNITESFRALLSYPATWSVGGTGEGKMATGKADRQRALIIS
jgi:hypothetical protein